MNPDQFDQYVETARGYCRRKLEESKAKFGLGAYNRFQYDLEKCAISFFDGDGMERVTAAIQIAGSWAPSSQTWLWAWDNQSIPKGSWKRLIAVKDYGKAEELPMLASSFGSCSEADAWAMAAVAGQILSCDGFYRVPKTTNQMFLLLFSIRKL